MKKLRQSLQHIEGAEILSREQLKKIIGGGEIGGTCATGQVYVWCQGTIRLPNGCGIGCDVYVHDCWNGCVNSVPEGCSTAPIYCSPGTT